MGNYKIRKEMQILHCADYSHEYFDQFLHLITVQYYHVLLLQLQLEQFLLTIK